MMLHNMLSPVSLISDMFIFDRVCDGDLLVNVIIMMLHNMLSPVSLISDMFIFDRV